MRWSKKGEKKNKSTMQMWMQLEGMLSWRRRSGLEREGVREFFHCRRGGVGRATGRGRGQLCRRRSGRSTGDCGGRAGRERGAGGRKLPPGVG